jgi:hypothetical protein
MSRLNGRYHGKFTEDYTDYDIDYYSRMEKLITMQREVVIVSLIIDVLDGEVVIDCWWVQ